MKLLLKENSEGIRRIMLKYERKNMILIGISVGVGEDLDRKHGSTTHMIVVPGPSSLSRKTCQ